MLTDKLRFMIFGGLLIALAVSIYFLSSRYRMAPVHPQTAHLSWKDNSKNENGFRIYRITGDQKTKIAEVGPNVTTFIDTNATPKACYVVTAFNSTEESSPTNKACLPD